jgi:hypothetical protein
MYYLAQGTKEPYWKGGPPQVRTGFSRIVISENEVCTTEYLTESGMKWMSGGVTRRCDQALGVHRVALPPNDIFTMS